MIYMMKMSLLLLMRVREARMGETIKDHQRPQPISLQSWCSAGVVDVHVKGSHWLISRVRPLPAPVFTPGLSSLPGKTFHSQFPLILALAENCQFCEQLQSSILNNSMMSPDNANVRFNSENRSCQRTNDWNNRENMAWMQMAWEGESSHQHGPKAPSGLAVKGLPD